MSLVKIGLRQADSHGQRFPAVQSLAASPCAQFCVTLLVQDISLWRWSSQRTRCKGAQEGEKGEAHRGRRNAEVKEIRIEGKILNGGKDTGDRVEVEEGWTSASRVVFVVG